MVWWPNNHSGRKVGKKLEASFTQARDEHEIVDGAAVLNEERADSTAEVSLEQRSRAGASIRCLWYWVRSRPSQWRFSQTVQYVGLPIWACLA